jgi:hypothetical protein
VSADHRAAALPYAELAAFLEAAVRAATAAPTTGDRS